MNQIFVGVNNDSDQLIYPSFTDTHFLTLHMKSGNLGKVTSHAARLNQHFQEEMGKGMFPHLLKLNQIKLN